MRLARWMGESISVDKEDLKSDGNRHSVRKFMMNSTVSWCPPAEVYEAGLHQYLRTLPSSPDRSR